MDLSQRLQAVEDIKMYSDLYQIEGDLIARCADAIYDITQIQSHIAGLVGNNSASLNALQKSVGSLRCHIAEALADLTAIGVIADERINNDGDLSSEHDAKLARIGRNDKEDYLRMQKEG